MCLIQLALGMYTRTVVHASRGTRTVVHASRGTRTVVHASRGTRPNFRLFRNVIGEKDMTSINANILKVYLLEVNTENQPTFGTYYDSCIVIAQDEAAAKKIHPSGDNDDFTYSDMWPDTDNFNLIEVSEVGIANSKQVEGAVLCASGSYG